MPVTGSSTFVSGRNRARVKIAFYCGVAILSLAPPIRLLRILSKTGDNTLSSDDGFLIPRFLGQVLGGGYNWLRFPEDTFRNAHSHLFPALTYLVMSRLNHLNIYWVLYLGVALAAAKLILLHSSITYPFRDRARWGRLLMWPLLSALVFSVSQMSVFEHGLQTLMTGFSQLGLAVSVWALARYPGRWTGVIIALTSAIVASLSFASGLGLFPLILGGMILLRFRKIGQYLLIIVGGGLIASLYRHFLYSDPATAGGNTAILRRFDPAFITETLGRPFVNQLVNISASSGPARIIGYFGIALTIIVVVFLILRGGRRELSRYIPGLLLALGGLGIVWQISMTRVVSSPWYTTFALDFWIGLTGMAYACSHKPTAARLEPEKRGAGARILAWAPQCNIAVIVIISLLWANSNRSWSDKSFFLRTRAPVSAASLRNYRTAPTYSEGTLEAWPMGSSPWYVEGLAKPLEDYHLSVFAPHQEWSLQGDSILCNVDYHQPAGTDRIIWSQDLGSTRGDFRDYRHLNLFIPDGGWVEWTITLPLEVDRAELRSAVAISDPVPKELPNSDVGFAVYVRPQDGEETELFRKGLNGLEKGWDSFSVQLSQYRGQTITLRFSERSSVHSLSGLFRYPTIDLNVRYSDHNQGESRPMAPCNTDLSAEFKKPGPEDFQFTMDNSDLWKCDQLAPVGRGAALSTCAVTGTNPSIEYRGSIGLNLDHYKRFFLTVSMSTEIQPRLATVYFTTTNDMHPWSHWFSIPLLQDDELHTYTFDLRLEDDLGGAELTGLKIRFLEPRWTNARVNPQSRLQVTEVGFISKSS